MDNKPLDLPIQDKKQSRLSKWLKKETILIINTETGYVEVGYVWLGIGACINFQVTLLFIAFILLFGDKPDNNESH